MSADDHVEAQEALAQKLLVPFEILNQSLHALFSSDQLLWTDDRLSTRARPWELPVKTALAALHCRCCR